ncbi:hypothetical protein J6590_084932 [Homalodisca vitripennis]|nr:hypothetical protein J6590_084932 [Homalodisca vitripennis]
MNAPVLAVFLKVAPDKQLAMSSITRNVVFRVSEKYRRPRKRAPPKLEANHKKKKSHATSGKRQKARQDFESNIWQRSLHPNPRKFSIRKVKKHFGSNLVSDEMNMSTCTPGAGHSVLVSVVSLGRLAAPVPLTTLTGTLPKVGELASHVERDEQRTDSKRIAGAGAGEQLVGKLVKVNQLTSTNQSNQAENQYSDGVTPPPTDKSGRGCNPKQNLSPTERRTNKLWHRKREVENPNRKRSPEQEADKTRSS